MDVIEGGNRISGGGKELNGFKEKPRCKKEGRKEGRNTLLTFLYGRAQM
jgi:hypothetical protein